MMIECLDAVRRHTADYQIIWIDNGSEAGEFQRIRAFLVDNKIPFRTIRNERNEGFIRAVNQGMRASTSEHLVLLNNDVVVTAGWLDKMLDFQRAHPRTGVIGVVTDTGTIQSYKSPRVYLLTGYKDGDPAEYHNALPSGLHREIVASCVPFSCVLMSKAMIRQVGMLDDDFSPGYGDDDDYCDRARLAGWKTVILLNVFVYHRHSVTFYSTFEKAYMDKLRADHKELYRRKYAERRQ
jgi:GT2 family glycosyltransferase